MALVNYQVVLDGQPTDAIFDMEWKAEEYLRHAGFGNRATISEIHDFPTIRKCLSDNFWDQGI